MGRLIPAGTGLPAYKRLRVVVDKESQPVEKPRYVEAERLAHQQLSAAVNEE